VLPVLLHCEDHLEEPLTLPALAAIAGFSPHHFHRVFHSVTGEAPKQYLRRLRLERAVHRLKVTPDNVLRIALESGFATHETFTRAFVRQFGISPSEFRAVLREYRKCVEDAMGSRAFAGFTEDTPLTLRFDLFKDPVTVEGRRRPRGICCSFATTGTRNCSPAGSHFSTSGTSSLPMRRHTASSTPPIFSSASPTTIRT